MATDFKLPELGENIKTIQVVKLLVTVGDTISVDQPVVELETDKATLEVPSTVSGRVSAIHVKAGDEIAVGHPVLAVEGGADAAPVAPPAVSAGKPVELTVPAGKSPAAPSPPPPPALGTVTRGEFVVPELGENIKTIQAVKVFVKTGQLITRDQAVLELETDKATLEVPSTVSGVITELRVKPGDELKVGGVVFIYEGQGAMPAAGATRPTPAAPTAAAPQVAAPVSAPTPAPIPAPAIPAGRRVPAAPSVRRFARQIGVDVNRVPGSGPHGRVSEDDVKRYAKGIIQGHAAPTGADHVAPGAGPALPPLPDFGKWGGVTREKMSVIRRKTAEQMALSWSQIPHVTLFDTADITELEELRKRYAERAEAAGGKLTLAVMLIKVVARALRVFPRFNTSIDMASREIIQKSYCNIGVAVDTERGLMVPVLRDADKHNLIQIAVALAQLAEKARTGRITVTELEGGSFTITNLGRSCGTFFTPIINYPEVAILGVGRALDETDPRTGRLRRKLPLSLSFDHRALDGADGVRFLGWIIEALAEPLVLSLEG